MSCRIFSAQGPSALAALQLCFDQYLNLVKDAESQSMTWALSAATANARGPIQIDNGEVYVVDLMLTGELIRADGDLWITLVTPSCIPLPEILSELSMLSLKDSGAADHLPGLRLCWGKVPQSQLTSLLEKTSWPWAQVLT